MAHKRGSDINLTYLVEAVKRLRPYTDFARLAQRLESDLTLRVALRHHSKIAPIYDSALGPLQKCRQAVGNGAL